LVILEFELRALHSLSPALSTNHISIPFDLIYFSDGVIRLYLFSWGQLHNTILPLFYISLGL
jgi:hypothetical protein